MKTNFDNLFLTQNALTENCAVVVRRRRPLRQMELFG
jgi:hypothetical protein